MSFRANNYRDTIVRERNSSRHELSTTIDGVPVPSRTIEEFKHMEAILRKKMDKLKQEVADSRRKQAAAEKGLQKERGKCEYLRQLLEIKKHI